MFPEIPGATFSSPTRDANGFDVYRLKSQYQKSETIIRVLLPSGYQADKSYPVVYVLPVEAGSGTDYGDGLVTVKNAGLQAQYAAIFVSPTFSDLPWYADHATDSTIWQETYFRSTVVPFIEARYPAIGTAASRLLLGFSKSGCGAFTMLLRHPNEFGRAVCLRFTAGVEQLEFLRIRHDSRILRELRELPHFDPPLDAGGRIEDAAGAAVHAGLQHVALASYLGRQNDDSAQHPARLR